MADSELLSRQRSSLSDATLAQLASAFAWKSAASGAKRTGKAVRHLPRAWGEMRSFLPRGPIARAADHGYSVWSTGSRWSIASFKAHGSAWSVWSVFSVGSVGSLLSLGSVLSVGSAGSLFSLGSAGSILSVGSAGSVLSIGGVNQQPWTKPGDPDGSPALSVIERAGTAAGVLAVLGAVGSSLLHAAE